MNQHETRALLRTRSALTSQPYSDDVVTAWCQALNEWTLDECRAALTKASREHKTITVAHLVERLPNHRIPISTQRNYDNWAGPTDNGRALAQQIRTHIQHRTELNHQATCPICQGKYHR